MFPSNSAASASASTAPYRNCPGLSDPHMRVQMVRRSPDGTEETSLPFSADDADSSPPSYPRGAVLRLSCAQGHRLNSPKRRVRCRVHRDGRGEWRPEARPRCLPVGCRLPPAGEGGVFRRDMGMLVLHLC